MPYWISVIVLSDAALSPSYLHSIFERRRSESLIGTALSICLYDKIQNEIRNEISEQNSEPNLERNSERNYEQISEQISE